MILHAYLRPAQLPDVHTAPNRSHAILYIILLRFSSASFMKPKKNTRLLVVNANELPVCPKHFRQLLFSRLCLHPVWQLNTTVGGTEFLAADEQRETRQ